MNGKVQIEGLSAFSRSLRRVDAEAAKGLRLAGNEAANFLIAKTKQKVPTNTGNAKESLKARSTRTAVRVSGGGRRAPYYAWLDFGGRVGRKKSVKRQFITEGRYLYPTLSEHREKFTGILQDALVKVAESAGMEVK